MDSPLFPPEMLQAFVDGELDAGAMARIQAAQDSSPELAGRIAGFQADKALVARVYDALIDLPVPARVMRSLTGAPAPPRRPMFRRLPGPRLAAGLAAAIAAAILVAWFLYPVATGPMPDSLIAQALAARRGESRPARLLTAQAADDQQLQDALDLPVKIPNLGRTGYSLDRVGFFPAAPGGSSLELRYRNRQGGMFTVFLHRRGGPDRFELAARGTLQICLWQNDELGAVMAGEMTATQMLKLASLAYADLNF